jgi:predicted RNA-binding Zn-ribbon protein involved in translation (DUF1610 family)
MILDRLSRWLRRKPPSPVADLAIGVAKVDESVHLHHPACRGSHANCPNCGTIGACVIPHKGSTRLTCTQCFRPFEPGGG